MLRTATPDNERVRLETVGAPSADFPFGLGLRITTASRVDVERALRVRKQLFNLLLETFGALQFVKAKHLLMPRAGLFAQHFFPPHFDPANIVIGLDHSQPDLPARPYPLSLVARCDLVPKVAKMEDDGAFASYSDDSMSADLRLMEDELHDVLQDPSGKALRSAFRRMKLELGSQVADFSFADHPDSVVVFRNTFRGGAQRLFHFVLPGEAQMTPVDEEPAFKSTCGFVLNDEFLPPETDV